MRRALILRLEHADRTERARAPSVTAWTLSRSRMTSPPHVVVDPQGARKNECTSTTASRNRSHRPTPLKTEPSQSSPTTAIAHAVRNAIILGMR
jgi:hypothetical protein